MHLYLNAVLHHSGNIMRQTARVLDLQIRRDAHHQSDDSSYILATPLSYTRKSRRKTRTSARCGAPRPRALRRTPTSKLTAKTTRQSRGRIRQLLKFV